MAAKITDLHELYENKLFSWLQVEDCVQGSDVIKRKNELYLPMPSGFWGITKTSDVMRTQQVGAVDSHLVEGATAPYKHNNPAYQSYLQRARFPDLCASTLRGLMGVATEEDPVFEIPASLDYLEEDSSTEHMPLAELYKHILMMVIKAGKVTLILDVRSDGSLYIAPYAATSNTNWEVIFLDGERVQVRSVMREFIIEGEGDQIVAYREYGLDNGIYTVWRYDEDGNQIGEPVVPKLNGKSLDFLPIVNIGSIKNSPDPDLIPMLGISDIAISVYQTTGDLRQSHFLTCNPTLFLFGVDSSEMPQQMGSHVAVGISDPSARAEYPATDTSALEHIRSYNNDLFTEAAAQAANFLTVSGSVEAAEALRIKKTSQTSMLVHIVNQVSQGVQEMLRFATEWSGSGDVTKTVFEGNTEFGSIAYSAQDITALVSSWLQGAIPHSELLDRFREAGIVSAEKTNEELQAEIEVEEPAIDESASDPENDEENDEDSDDDADGDEDDEDEDENPPASKGKKKAKSKA